MEKFPFLPRYRNNLGCQRCFKNHDRDFAARPSRLINEKKFFYTKYPFVGRKDSISPYAKELLQRCPTLDPVEHQNRHPAKRRRRHQIEILHARFLAWSNLRCDDNDTVQRALSKRRIEEERRRKKEKKERKRKKKKRESAKEKE